jgi:hypothetical protein
MLPFRPIVAALGVIAITLAAFASSRPLTSAQDQTATLQAVATSKSVSTNKDVDVEIQGSELANLGAFQLVLSVDPNVLQPVSIDKTEFLASSGRETYCDPPTIDSASILFVCTTLRPTPANGVDGTGTLAIARFRSKGKGTTDLALSHVKLAHPDGSELTSTTADGQLSVTSGSGFFSATNMGIIAGSVVVALIVAGGAAFAIARRRSAASTSGMPSR